MFLFLDNKEGSELATSREKINWCGLLLINTLGFFGGEISAVGEPLAPTHMSWWKFY